MRRNVVFAFIAAGIVVTPFVLTRSRARAQVVPQPCDFITGGGFVFKDNGERANFGAHGGCKNGSFWGHVNYVDHDPVPFVGTKSPYHVDSTEITGYLTVPGFPNARDICGIARTNADEIVRFRVRMEDNGEGRSAIAPDRFGIRLSNGYLVLTRPLGGGNVQLHKPNPSTTGPNPPPDEPTMCAGVPGPVPTPQPTPPS
jgi:hypothetical protein